MFEVLINFIILEPEQWIFLNQTIHVLNSSASSSPYFIIQKKKKNWWFRQFSDLIKSLVFN